MAKFERPKPGRTPGGDDAPSKVKILEKIVEPKCKICKDKRRDQIDYLLAMKTPYNELERLFGLPARSFSNHAAKHLRYEDEAIKRIIEHEAGLAGENLEAGVKGAFLRRTTLDIFIKKFFDAVAAGDVTVEAKDAVKMIEIREKLDAESASAQIEQYELQFNAFKEAVEEICAPEQMQEILMVVKQKLQLPEAPALQAPEE